MRFIIIIILISVSYAYSQDIQNDTSRTKANFIKPEIVVTANRSDETEFEATENISVISQEQLFINMPRTLPEAAFNTPGVWVQKTNHGGGSPFIRGFTGNQSLYLIDGIRLNNSTFRYGPNQYVNTIDPLMVRKIEVMKGGGSVQYGSDAIGGVFQIFTIKPNFTESPKYAGQIIGHYGAIDIEKSANIRANYSSLRFATSVAASYKDYGNIIVGEGKELNPTGYNEYSYDFKAIGNITENSTLLMAANGLRQNDVPLYHKVALEDYEYYNFDPQARHLAYLRYNHKIEKKWIKNITATSAFINSLEGRQRSNNNSDEIIDDEDEINTLVGIVEIVGNPYKGYSYSCGMEVYSDKINSKRLLITPTSEIQERGLYPDNSSYLSYSAFLMNNIKYNRFSFDFGLRYNGFNIEVKNTDGENIEITPQAFVASGAINFLITNNHKITALISNSFRGPNINDLGSLGEIDFRYEVPNFNLKPETATNYELVYKISNKKILASGSIYYNMLNNLITRTRGFYKGQDSINGIPIYIKENASNSYVYGAEASIEFIISNNLKANANIAYTFGHNISKQEPMRRIPPLFGKIEAIYSETNYYVGGEILWAGSQTRLSGGDIDDNRIAEGGTDGWAILNIMAGYNYRFVDIYLKVNNVFDSLYRYHGSGVDGYGRYASIGVNVNLK